MRNAAPSPLPAAIHTYLHECSNRAQGDKAELRRIRHVRRVLEVLQRAGLPLDTVGSEELRPTTGTTTLAWYVLDGQARVVGNLEVALYTDNTYGWEVALHRVDPSTNGKVTLFPTTAQRRGLQRLPVASLRAFAERTQRFNLSLRPSALVQAA